MPSKEFVPSLEEFENDLFALYSLRKEWDIKWTKDKTNPIVLAECNKLSWETRELCDKIEEIYGKDKMNELHRKVFFHFFA